MLSITDIVSAKQISMQDRKYFESRSYETSANFVKITLCNTFENN